MKRENAASQQGTKGKTLIGVLASHDSPNGKNKELAELFEKLYDQNKGVLEKFHFLFTGGTFDRLLLTDKERKKKEVKNAFPISDQQIRQFVRGNSTRLPSFNQGGVTILANFVVQRQCRIVWTFLDPTTTHWLNPENLALFRLCDIWKAKRLMNSESVRAWFEHAAQRDAERNCQGIPIELRFGTGYLEGNLASPPQQAQGPNEKGRHYEIGIDRQSQGQNEGKNDWGDKTIALIAHDEMKGRMVDFAIEYEDELARFKRILTTGTTGREVQEATRKLQAKICRCRSGPKGGDIEIATEIVFGHCHVVVFFIDPLNPHPHTDDIRVVFSACMRNSKVQMLTNEVHAREWMEEAVRHTQKAR